MRNVANCSIPSQVDELSERSDSELDDLYNLNNFKDDILFKDYDPATDDDDDDGE